MNPLTKTVGLSLIRVLTLLIFSGCNPTSSSSSQTDIAGFWTEKSKANQNVIPYGDRTKFLMITRISDISYNVVFSIDKDEQFDAVFTLTGDKLIGTKKTLFSDIEQTLYLSNNNELYFENEKTFFARIGKPSTSHSGEKPVLQGTLQDFLWNAFKGARVGFVGVILYVAYLFIRSLVSKK